MATVSLKATESSRRIGVFLLSALMSFLVVEPALATMAQKPLFVGGSVKPNIVFVLDDSGSMQYETMDGSVTNYFGSTIADEMVMLVYPRIDGVFGDEDNEYDNDRVPYFDRDMSAFFRSPQNNRLYYDPSVTYKPWMTHDGENRYSKATTTNALHNPAIPSLGGRNLAEENSESAQWVDDDGDHVTHTDTFWPAVYYWYNGSGDRDDADNYEKVEIRKGETFTGHGRGGTNADGQPNRPDCDAANMCTYDEEIQNFANWYSYHRNRVFAARAGIGEAFAQQGDDIRVGYGSINTEERNIDGVQTPTLVRGVRDFSGSGKEDFFDWLYDSEIPDSGTPLLTALRDVGEYFERTDSKGPYNETPGQGGGENRACHSNYSILMSDGYWSETYWEPGPWGGGSWVEYDPEVDNADGTNGQQITGENNQSYQYQADDPFRDNHSDTLADVAMEYWKRDLTDLPNNMTGSIRNPAFWQHMVTYTIGLGVSGSIDAEAAFDAIEDGDDIDWPDPWEDGESAKIDDMLHAAVNSRGASFTAQNPTDFATALDGMLTDMGNRGVGSSASIATSSTRLDTDTFIYQARFDSRDWSGELLAFELDEDDGSIADTPFWTAEDGIDGIRNIVTFVPGPKNSLDENDGIVTNDPSSGTTAEFEWNNLTAWQETALKTDPDDGSEGTEADARDRIDWLWGGQAEEKQNGGDLRDREKLLGDIVNSDPLFVGDQDFGYWMRSEDTGDKWDEYRGFVDDLRDNDPALLVGANDGKFHAFEAETGEEIFAYVPNMVYEGLSALTDPGYTHQYLVDGDPVMNDVHDGSEWRRMVVGTLGAGGEGLFALDVTGIGESAGSYTPDVLWEITNEHDAFEGNLGHIVGSATIALLPDEKWYAIFGNGYDSDSGNASLYLVEMTDPTNVHEFEVDDTGGNGMSPPAAIDSDGDRAVDTIYAGDLQGNLWEFDVSNDKNSNQWGVANGGDPLFVAKSRNDRRQPITASPEVTRHEDGGVMVFFGTGKYFELEDGTVGNDPVIHSLYGIRDDGSGDTVLRDELVGQEIIAELSADAASNEFDQNLRVTSDNAQPENPDERMGWHLDLLYPPDNESAADGERSVTRPIIRGSRIVFTTLIPSSDPCAGGGDSWIMEMNAMTGSRLDTPPFDLDDDGEFTEGDNVEIVDEDGNTIQVPVTGIGPDLGIISNPSIISSGGEENKYISGSTGRRGQIREQGDDSRGRRSWRERQ